MGLNTSQEQKFIAAQRLKLLFNDVHKFLLRQWPTIYGTLSLSANGKFCTNIKGWYKKISLNLISLQR